MQHREDFEDHKNRLQQGEYPITHKGQEQHTELYKGSGLKGQGGEEQVTKIVFGFISVLWTKVEFMRDGKEMPTRQDTTQHDQVLCPAEGFSGKAFVVNKTLEQREMQISRQVKRAVTDAPGHRHFSATEGGGGKNKIK